MAKDTKKIKVKWEYVETTPEETESRLSKAFDILLGEVLKNEKFNNSSLN